MKPFCTDTINMTLNRNHSLTNSNLQHHCIDPCTTGTCSAADFCRVFSIHNYFSAIFRPSDNFVIRLTISDKYCPQVMIHRPICGFNERPTPPPIEDNFVIGERFFIYIDKNIATVKPIMIFNFYLSTAIK